MTKRNYRPKKRGFTLLEILVASSVSLLLGLAIVNAFMYSNRSLAHATERISLVQRTRLPAARLADYLNSAIGIPDLPTVLYPPVSSSGTVANLQGTTIVDDDPSTWDQLIVFRTTEDFLNPAYDPETIMDTTDIRNNLGIWERDEQRLNEYVIWYEGDDIDWIANVDNAIVMARFDNLTDSTDRDTAWVRSWYTTVSQGSIPQLEPAVDLFYIAQNVDDVRFRRRLASGIQISVSAEETVSTASGGRELKTFRFDAMAQTPSIQMNF